MDEIIPLNSFLLFTYQNFGFSFWIALLVLILLLIISGLTSGSEVAFFSLTPEEKENIKENDKSFASTTLALLKKPKDLLAVILITNNFINIAIVILSSYIFQLIYPENITDIGSANIIRSIIEVVGITFILLLIGEVIPKIYANQNRLKFISIMASPLNIMHKTPPLSWLKNFLVQGTDMILKYANTRQIDVSTDDLETAIAITREESTTLDEQKILEGIINFGNTDVRQIMRSRVDTVAVNQDLNFEDLIKIILENGYSRIPVYKETFDHVTGILFIKDLLPFIDESKDFEWNKVLRQPFFVPENKKIDDLLKEFQDRKTHIAVVVDEYGGSSGVVTLEDILEEIIGEITDEFDDKDIVYTKIDDKTYLFEGKTSLIDMYKVLDINGKSFEEEKGESDSIGGFLVEQAGKIMRNNEVFEFENLKFIVEASDKKRIRMVKVIKQ